MLDYKKNIFNFTFNEYWFSAMAVFTVLLPLGLDGHPMNLPFSPA